MGPIYPSIQSEIVLSKTWLTNTTLSKVSFVAKQDYILITKQLPDKIEPCTKLGSVLITSLIEHYNYLDTINGCQLGQCTSNCAKLTV